jgi:tetratricopeptide (TPR) repeat protein
MLTGHLPFEGHSALAVAVKQKSQNPVSPKRFNPHIPDSLCHVILKCLEKRREKRFDDVTALREELMRIGEALHLTPGTQPKRIITRKFTKAGSNRPRWMVAAAAAVVFVGGFLALNPGLLRRARGYDNYISLEVAGSGSARVWLRPVEFVLNRALSSSAKKYIFVHEDLLTYKKRTKSEASVFRPAELSIVGDIVAKVMGFDINLTTRFRGKTSRRTFDCKGQLDFLTLRADDIIRYLSDFTGGLIAPPQAGRSVSRIFTANIDALEHFLSGEDAWARLKLDQAFYEYRTALENDPSFALAHLRLVDVLIYRLDLEAARDHLERALAQEDRLTDLDLLRLRALQARLDSKPNEERQFLRKLTEEFPFKKEYHYEFAESYFHYGDAGEAIQHYLKALELDGNYALAHNHIAYCYSWIGEHDKALAHLQKYRTLDPTANSYDSLAAGYMYAGDYAQALSVVRDGLKVDPKLDFLYLNQLHNHLLLGQLVQGHEAIRQQAAVTTRDVAKNSIGFWLAFVEFLKGDLYGARRSLAPSLEVFRKEAYRDRLDEYPNSASWLAGVIAARSGNSRELEKELGWMEDKIRRHSISATNFSPIWKFYVHLKILSGALKRDRGEVLRYVEEGRQLRAKMGYWGSFFNLAYFYNLYAEALLALPDSQTSGVLLEAKSLLDEANRYNSRYAWTHLNLARLYLVQGNRESVRTECSQAKDILSGSDPDYVLKKNLLEIEARLTD